MPTKEQLRKLLRTQLAETVQRINAVLAGKGVAELESVLARLGRGQQFPHWYEGLRKDHVLPNLDGKTIGSVIEMMLVAVLETFTFKGKSCPPLKINPARGVDLPDLDLGVKSPSENYCTSEPFFSAYERLIGSTHDVLVLITDYQEAKHKPPLKLQIIKYRYLTQSEVADRNLCHIALAHRGWFLKDSEARAKRLIRFLAYINQRDWRANRLLKMVANFQDDAAIQEVIKKAENEFIKTNKQKLKKDDIPIPDEELQALKDVLKLKNSLYLGVIDAADNWIIETVKDAARAPNDDEWKRFLASSLNGKISMSLALQWRYSFKTLFGLPDEDEDEEC
jgi:hypothetical protein